MSLTDFGIASIRTEASRSDKGDLKGKLAYLSPEQVSGGIVDHRSDLFAVGIVLFEVLSGNRLFHSESEAQTIMNVAQRETTGFSTDEKILQSFVYALERLYPRVRFAMRLARRAVEPSQIVQAATHHIRSESMDEVSITEAGLRRAGWAQPSTAPHGMNLRRTYGAILLPGPGERDAPADGP